MGSKEEVDWADIFDLISSEYGWTTSQIWAMTMREVDWRIKAIINRTNLSNKFEALLHDKEMKIPDVKKKKEEPIQVSKEQENAMAKAIEAAKQRKAREYGKR